MQNTVARPFFLASQLQKLRGLRRTKKMRQSGYDAQPIEAFPVQGTMKRGDRAHMFRFGGAWHGMACPRRGWDKSRAYSHKRPELRRTYQENKRLRK